MQTLSVQTTVSAAKIVEIPVPFFARTKDESKYIGLLDEKTFLSFFSLRDFINICHTEPGLVEKRNLVEAFTDAGWTACTETEFLEKYDAVIESISLHPKLAV